MLNAMPRITDRIANKRHAFLPHSHWRSEEQSRTELGAYRNHDKHTSEKKPLQSCLGPASKGGSASASVQKQEKRLPEF